MVAVHKEHVPQGEHPAAEKLCRAAVQGDHIAVVYHAQGGGYRDAQGRSKFRVFQIVLLGIGAGLKVPACQGNPAFAHLQLLCHHLGQALKLAAASCQEHSRGGAPVDFHCFLGDLFGKPLGGGAGKLPQILGIRLVLHAQDVGIGLRLFGAYGKLQALGGFEVYQEALHQRLRYLVPCYGSHGVAHHAALPAHCQVGGAGANICQHQVQKPDILRDCRVQGGDRLQGEGGHFQPQPGHHGIQAFHHPAGQEGCHYLYLKLPAPVA